MERLFDVYDTGRSDGPADERAPDDPEEPRLPSQGGERSRYPDASTLDTSAVTPPDTPPAPPAHDGPSRGSVADAPEARDDDPPEWLAGSHTPPPAAPTERDDAESVFATRAAEPRPAIRPALVEEPPTPLTPRPPLALDPQRRVRHVGDGEPLDGRMRPRSLDEFVGQRHIVGPDKPFTEMLQRGQLPPLLLWGPSGCGKRSLAHVIARHLGSDLVELPERTSAATLRAVVDEARQRSRATGRATVLFVSPVHELEPDLQEIVVPALAEGVVQFVGATTTNPVFELSSPLMARCKLIQLNKLEPADITTIVQRAVEDPHRGVGDRVELTFAAQRQIVSIANGNARVALATLERAVDETSRDRDGVIRIDAEEARAAVRAARSVHDTEEHYDQISAFVRSLRASHPDAAVYWLLRLIESGEEPRFLTRRMMMFASEEIGLADSQALVVATSAAEAVDRVGLPEAKHVLVHAALALAVAPKSDRVARALEAATIAVDETADASVPEHLRDSYAGSNAGSGGIERVLGGASGLDHLPEDLHGRRIYEPSESGDEAAIAERVAVWREQLDVASSRRRAARATRQSGFIEGLDRASWTRGDRPGPRESDRGFGSNEDGSDV